MSKHETKMTRWYAEKRYPKGYLIEEFMALEAGPKNGRRLIDGVIIFAKPYEKRELNKGERVVVIQSKHRKLGMGLIGQVVVSRELLTDLKAKVVKSVGVCREDDLLLHKVLRRFKKCEAVVYRRGKK